MLLSQKFDLIKTIDDGDEVPDLSEESDEEEEFQPTKEKSKNSKEFNADFNFVSQGDCNQDPWNDVAKYIKKAVKRKTDDKIELIKSKKKLEQNEVKNEPNESDGSDNDKDNNEDEDDNYLSDTDLIHDDIKEKQTKIKKKKTDLEFSEEVTENQEITSFYQMNLSRPLMKGISSMNFIHPTPIQCATIPIALLGRDICGCAATGTGKTAAYMLPVLERLLYKPQGSLSITRVLVLVPTRELGVQVYQVSKQLAHFTTVEIGLAVGGLDVKSQEAFLRRQPDIVIATPGRLIDHLKNAPGFSLDSIEILVLDEADRMLDEYFAEQMKEIVKQCARNRQTMLFSATMTTAVEDLASVSLSNPVKIFVDSNQSVTFNLRQEFIRIRKGREGEREAILAALVCRTFRTNCIIFVTTKSQAHRLHILLGFLNIKVGELHGNLKQPERLDTLNRFRDGAIDVLVATDVAARGLDIVGVKTVINFELPTTFEHYIHRVGRTARAGRSGISVSLACESERKLVKEIVKKAKRPVKSRIIPPKTLEKYKEKVTELSEDIEKVLKEELEERLLEKAEKQMGVLEKQINSMVDDSNRTREWFQTKKERKQEQTRLKKQRETELKEMGKKNKGKGKVIVKSKLKKKEKVLPPPKPSKKVGKGPQRKLPSKKKGKHKSVFDY
ncbi:putative ATP-dependent RNA helicase ddx27 [Polyplax serrata]|uniref:RNA helicase n=1 Tax=Polyplax serrata TaxID=468196 RepID=A0ABR1ATA5_POLSC